MTIILCLILAALPATPSPALDVSPRPEQRGAPQSLTAGDRTGVGSTPWPAASGERTPGGAPLPGPLLGGWATHYPAASATDGAAGPDLRALFGRDWRGQWVSVCHDGECVRVQLRDFCACGDRHGKATLIDLPKQTFARLAPLGRGVIEVSVEPARIPALPATDMEERPTWRHR